MEHCNFQDGEFYVFVYGTLKPGGRAYKRFCEPYLIAMEAAKAPGRLYKLSMGYPAMTLESGWVMGVRLTFNNPTVLKNMDDFEDYYPNHPEHSEYQRVCHTVYNLEGSSPSAAWVYVMNREQIDQCGGQWLPDGSWSERS